VEERAVKIQRDVEQHANELAARDPRSRAHAELTSYGTGGQYAALVVGRFGELSKGFVKLRDYFALQKEIRPENKRNSPMGLAKRR
jgi:hypothetical protein